MQSSAQSHFALSHCGHWQGKAALCAQHQVDANAKRSFALRPVHPPLRSARSAECKASFALPGSTVATGLQLHLLACELTRTRTARTDTARGCKQQMRQNRAPRRAALARIVASAQTVRCTGPSRSPEMQPCAHAVQWFDGIYVAETCWSVRRAHAVELDRLVVAVGNPLLRREMTRTLPGQARRMKHVLKVLRGRAWARSLQRCRGGAHRPQCNARPCASHTSSPSPRSATSISELKVCGFLCPKCGNFT